jgi:hypothetical protein
LEFALFAEIVYIVLLLLGNKKIIFVIVGFILLYLFYKSYNRFINVKGRCKTSEAYKKYSSKSDLK